MGEGRTCFDHQNILKENNSWTPIWMYIRRTLAKMGLGGAGDLSEWVTADIA